MSKEKTISPQGLFPRPAPSKYPIRTTHIVLTVEEFNRLGRPTATDEITLKLSLAKHEG
jgi:hypothetical protein